jgi:hypothetical protein
MNLVDAYMTAKGGHSTPLSSSMMRWRASWAYYCVDENFKLMKWSSRSKRLSWDASVDCSCSRTSFTFDSAANLSIPVTVWSVPKTWIYFEGDRIALCFSAMVGSMR